MDIKLCASGSIARMTAMRRNTATGWYLRKGDPELHNIPRPMRTRELLGLVIPSKVTCALWSQFKGVGWKEGVRGSDSEYQVVFVGLASVLEPLVELY